jgi:Fe2+ transport system protein FeoA
MVVTIIEQSPALVRLDELPPRTCAVVRSVATDDEDTLRLKTLGVCVGRRVELVRAGNPLILKIFGSRLGISADLAARVQVEVCTPGHCAMRDHNGA